jgi:hypothetical protein
MVTIWSDPLRQAGLKPVGLVNSPFRRYAATSKAAGQRAIGPVFRSRIARSPSHWPLTTRPAHPNRLNFGTRPRSRGGSADSGSRFTCFNGRGNSRVNAVRRWVASSVRPGFQILRPQLKQRVATRLGAVMSGVRGVAVLSCLLEIGALVALGGPIMAGAAVQELGPSCMRQDACEPGASDIAWAHVQNNQAL